MNRRNFLKTTGAAIAVLFLRLPKIRLPKSTRVEQEVGRTLYVNGDVRIGNDHNDGLTPQTAKRTISAAIAAAGLVGTVYVFPGDYIESGLLEVNCAGFYMHDSRITIERGDNCISFPDPDKTHFEVTSCYFEVLEQTGTTIRLGEAVANGY